MNETLKFPTGDFTHTDLAKLNGKTNQQVWVRYQQAIKDGVIVSAGTRPSVSGKGKPSKLWKVNPNPPSPVTVAPAPVAVTVPPVITTPVVPTEPIVVPAAAPVAVVAVSTPEVVAPAAVVSPVPEPTPAAAPAPAAETTTIVEVVRIEPAPESKPFTLPAEVLKDVRTLTEICPVCGKPLSAMNDATGVIVWCGQSKEICPSVENPFGHANTDKNAYEILMQKWGKSAITTA